MDVPPALKSKMDLYRTHGRIVRENNELFAEVAWLQVMHGQHLEARGYHPLVDSLDEAQVATYLREIHTLMARCAEVMPDHAEFIARHCAAPPAQRAA